MRTPVLSCLLKGPTETESKTPGGCLASLRNFHGDQKPKKASEEAKKKRKRKKKSKQTIPRAVTHIRLLEANAGKLSTLDALMTVYLELCQQYLTLFCQAESKPDKWSEPVFDTELSDRLHRVALQQAAGIAKSFRTNRARAYQAYLELV